MGSIPTLGSTLKSPDASRAGRVKPLVAGDYVLTLGWSVGEIGWVQADPAFVTVPWCGVGAPPENGELPATGPRTTVLAMIAVAIGLMSGGLALMAFSRRVSDG